MASQTKIEMPSWYNRPLLDGIEDNRISVTPSAEHGPMDNDDPLFPIRMAVPAYGRQMVPAGRSPAQLRSQSAVVALPLPALHFLEVPQGTTSVAKHRQGRASASSIRHLNDAGEH